MAAPADAASIANAAAAKSAAPAAQIRKDIGAKTVRARSAFDYGSEAELYHPRSRTARRQPVGYRRGHSGRGRHSLRHRGPAAGASARRRSRSRREAIRQPRDPSPVRQRWLSSAPPQGGLVREVLPTGELDAALATLFRTAAEEPRVKRFSDLSAAKG